MNATRYDAVNDEVDGVLAGHVLLTEKPRGGALCLSEYCYKTLCAGPCRTPPLCIVRRALDYALKASGLLERRTTVLTTLSTPPICVGVGTLDRFLDFIGQQ